MTALWIIHTGAKGEIDESIMLRTNSKRKVGKYIRNNLEKFMFVFQKFCVCNDYGEIVSDLSELYDDSRLDMYDDKDRDEVITTISKVLKDYTDEEIVDELHGPSCDSAQDYAN